MNYYNMYQTPNLSRFQVAPNSQNINFNLANFNDYNKSTAMKLHTVKNKVSRAHPKVKFTVEEDEKLKEIVHKYGSSDWELISSKMPGRNVRQCKERWQNYLSPDVNNSPWTQEDDDLLIAKHAELGAKWVKIASFFVGRSDTSIKNRWMVLQRRNQSSQKVQSHQISNQQMYAMKPLNSVTMPAIVNVDIQKMQPPKENIHNNIQNNENFKVNDENQINAEDEIDFWDDLFKNTNEYDFSW